MHNHGPSAHVPRAPSEFARTIAVHDHGLRPRPTGEALPPNRTVAGERERSQRSQGLGASPPPVRLARRGEREVIVP